MRRAAPASQQAYPDDSSPFQPARRRSLLQRTIPVSGQLRRYRAGTARRDLLAGVTVAALAVPAAMAYAELAGLSPVNGLYALLLPTVAYVLLGSSRQLVVGPEGSISALVAVSVLSFAAAGTADAAELGAILALLVAACFLVAFVLRLGWLADYFSRPVLIGYIHGVAVVLIIGQLGKLTGIGIGASRPVPQLVEAVKEISNVSGATLAVAAIALAVMLPLRWIAPRFPAALVVVVAGIAASVWLNLDDHGVAVVGHIPSGLPSLTFPTPPLNQVFDLVPAALGLFLVSFADEVLTARAYAQRHGERIDVGQEIRAMAVANATAGVSQAFPVGASGSRTAVNDSMGARSQVSALLAAIAVVGILLFLTAPIAHLPKAVLGAAIVSAAVGLIDISSWRALAAADRVEVAIAAITTAGVVLVGVLEAVVFAVGLTILDAVRRSAQPGDAVLGFDAVLGRFANVADHPEARVEPGIVVYRLDDRLFFANARYVTGRMRQAVRGAPTPAHWLVLDAEGISHIDTTGMEALKNLVGELDDGGVALVVARMRTALQGLLGDAGLEAEIGADHFYPTVRAAVGACVREESGADTPQHTTGMEREPGDRSDRRYPGA
jgi:high affinity sulfate transporter 1